MSRLFSPFIAVVVMIIVFALFTLVGCTLGNAEHVTIYITATPYTTNNTQATERAVPTHDIIQSGLIASQPTADPTRNALMTRPDEYIVQPGDTLSGIATRYNISVENLISINQIENPDILSVGQSILLPSLPEAYTPGNKIMSDIRFVRGPLSAEFDINSFIIQQVGMIRTHTDNVSTRVADGSEILIEMTATEIVQRVSTEYSIDERILLTLLEYQAGWLSRIDVASELVDYPLYKPVDPTDTRRQGLYRQLSWAANRLNAAYYGWKSRGWVELTINNDRSLLFYPTLNAASVAIQYYFSSQRTYEDWTQAVSTEGFFQTYYSYFGDPFTNHAVDELITEQPELTLPFASNETWYYTGGPHGGWGSGSGWAALDFAPPDDIAGGGLCFTSEYPVRAVAAGVIARSGDGAVVLDIDGDGNEVTGWNILYLHIADQGRIGFGSIVAVGDPVGYASCAGGFSTATHLHIARKYNGEWIVADCTQCSPHHSNPAFVMSGWRAEEIPGQEYQGYMINGSERRVAEQGRNIANNQVSWLVENE